MGTNAQLDRVTDWVAELRPTDLIRVAPLRLEQGVEGASDPDEELLWFRGEKISNAVLSLPFLCLYRIEDEESRRLFPVDSELPSKVLPRDLTWVPLSEMIVPGEVSPTPPVTRPVQPAPLQLVRGGNPEIPNLLRTSRTVWKDYAVTAPKIRLDRLHFAVSPGEVFVRGMPLPPISGQMYFERDGIALPAGFRFSPDAAPGIVAASFGLGPREIAIFSPNGIVEKIGAEMFLPATRESVRLSLP